MTEPKSTARKKAPAKPKEPKLDESGNLVKTGVGNPNPSVNTRFGAPNGNKPGCTSETRRLAIASAERAARIQETLLTIMEEQLAEMVKVDATAANNAAILKEFLKPANLALFKQVQDRGLGTPTQSIDLNNPDGNLAPAVKILFVDPDEADES